MTSEAKADQNLRGSGRSVTRAEKQPAEAVRAVRMERKTEKKKRKQQQQQHCSQKEKTVSTHFVFFFFIFVKIKNNYCSIEAQMGHKDKVTLQTHTDAH